MTPEQMYRLLRFERRWAWRHAQPYPGPSTPAAAYFAEWWARSLYREP